MNMGWVEEEYQDRMNSGGTSELESERELRFEERAKQLWRQLAAELRNDVDEYNRQGGIANFTEVAENEIRIADQDSRLTLTVRVDLEGHTVHYSYGSLNPHVASPEDGIFSIHRSHYGSPALFSADQRIHSEGARQLLLEPILFPPDLAA